MRKGRLILGLVTIFALSMCNNSTDNNENHDDTTNTSSIKQTTVEETIPVQTVASNDTEALPTVLTGKETKVKIETSKGTMIVALYDQTPRHRDNFIKLVKSGFYNDLLFHRVIKNFMIQGGDPQSKGAAPGVQLGNGGPGYTIPAEFDSTLIHKKGALAAARMGDNVNPKRESSGSQFYIVQGQKYSPAQFRGSSYTPEQIQVYSTIGGTPHLDRGYTVFGEVIEGLEVIDLIAAVQTRPGDRPVEDVTMKMSIVK